MQLNTNSLFRNNENNCYSAIPRERLNNYYYSQLSVIISNKQSKITFLPSGIASHFYYPHANRKIIIFFIIFTYYSQFFYFYVIFCPIQIYLKRSGGFCKSKCQREKKKENEKSCPVKRSMGIPASRRWYKTTSGGDPGLIVVSW
jgi:hypothetical protein